MSKQMHVSRFAITAVIGGVLAVAWPSLLLSATASGNQQKKKAPTKAAPALRRGNRAPVREQAVRDLLKAQEQLQKQIELSARVRPGTEQEARDYYERISTVLQFPFQASTLDSLLAYMGYTTSNGANPPSYAGLIAKDLESIPSFPLMPRDDGEFAALKARVTDPNAFDSQLDLADFQGDRVLVSRFFAPKIATYYYSPPQDPFPPIHRDDIVPGWRKLVRLTARPGSEADRVRKIAYMYLLFNVKKEDADTDPFVDETRADKVNVSQNNQVILVPRDQSTGDSAYFAVYNSLNLGYRLINFLAADFDLPGHVGTEVSKYYVPRACAECHGHSAAGGRLIGQPVDAQGQPTDNFKTGIYRFAKPNYLDTDQWYDWMEFDFRGVTTSLNDVVFDGGKSHGSAEYLRAMDVIRKLNRIIRDQTFAAEQVPGTKSYQTLAAEKWLSLHETDLQRAPYSRRSIGTESWNSGSKNEMRLLRLLNNHCFRCHSSLRYNVFDRDAVRLRKGDMEIYLTLKLGNLPGFYMPQGRVLETAERDEIRNLLKTVFPQ
jgi:hypothetical protein